MVRYLLWQIDHLRTFKESFGEFTCLTYSYTLAKESGIWLGKISANDSYLLCQNSPKFSHARILCMLYGSYGQLNLELKCNR